MDEPTRETDSEGTSGHGLLPMILGCGLTLVAVLVFGVAGSGWGVAVLAIALLVCPLLMLGLWWMTEGGQRPPQARTDKGTFSARPGVLAVVVVVTGLVIGTARDLRNSGAAATPTPYHEGQPSQMATPSPMEPTVFPFPEPEHRPTADMMAEGGAAMIAAADAMDDAAEVMAVSDDPTLVEMSDHWRRDAVALRERGAWMVMTATSSGMVHDPDRVHELDVWNLKANGAAMTAEGEAMAAHGREIQSEANRFRVAGALPSDLAADLVAAGQVLVNAGDALRDDGIQMERYADGLIQSLGMRP